MRRLVTIALAALIGCAAPETTRRADIGLLTLPAMNTFGARTPPGPRLSNAIIARDFLDLAFRLENGANLLTFSRFEGPT
ncbi:MAG: ATP-dependent transcriptional regulator, partial [Pseudomonadota bacterium]